MTTITPDYLERTYAGVLGKIIGVYLGRPFEGWTYDRIMANLGEIDHYVHEQLGMPLIVTDDDISGTFTFLRALPDYGTSLDLTPAQIGQSWLNYIIEKKTILWWGGMGNSTEHTAYIRLKQGIPAPQSGSIALNSKVVAEQIGSQIFIDGWGMINPGDPERAADFARRAGSVSHDGEAIYGAQVVAAMEAQAYVEHDLNVLLDTATRLIPKDSIIYRMIDDIREWHAEFPDWHDTRDQIAANYGYDKFGGGCHMIPNHALIIMSLLHGADNFGKSLMMVNTAGWDTDCNSGNVGCILGIKNGLAGLEGGYDFRTPVADRLYLPTAEGGSAINDAVQQTYTVVNLGRKLANQPVLEPKNGARFHFELPGSVQGFQVAEGSGSVENVAGHSASGSRSLALHYDQSLQASTLTFIPLEAINMRGYTLLACPTLYPGQRVTASLEADASNSQAVTAKLFVCYYGTHDALAHRDGPSQTLTPGQRGAFEWAIPALNGAPVAEIGFEVSGGKGTVYLDYLTWDGEANVTLKDPGDGSDMWRRAWVDATDNSEWRYPEAYRLIQNYGTGLMIQGTRQWKDYRVTADVTPHMVQAAGIGARVQGLLRYYGLVLRKDSVALVKVLDGEQVLASKLYRWEFGTTYQMSLQAKGNHLQGWINGELVLDVTDANSPLLDGAAALLVTEGRTATESVTIQPAS
ncbi:MAG: ADP-ribosylglycohydrolase family protein [Chloroflexota bacterium]